MTLIKISNGKHMPFYEVKIDLKMRFMPLLLF